jgi:hypothetical protein
MVRMLQTVTLPIILIGVILGLAACNSASERKQQNTGHSLYAHIEKVSGEWAKDCTSGSGNIVILRTLDTALMEITTNQVQIAAGINIERTNRKVTLSFHLIAPYDLGAGGARLNWNNFSRDSIIARMEVIDTAHAKLTWYGFYDTKEDKRIWKDGFDIFADDRSKNQADIVKCNDFIFSK